MTIPGRTEMTVSPAGSVEPMRTCLLHVVQRPWPWVLRYLLTAVPAVALGLLLALPLGPWFRLPLFVRALDRRSLDDLLEVLLNQPEGQSLGPSLGAALILVPIAWLGLRVIGLWLEGGILATYALPTVPAWRAFATTSTRWFGSFLLLALVGIGAGAALTGGTVGLALLAGMISRPLGIGVGLAGALVVIFAGAWARLARAVVVVREDGHIVRALRQAWHTMWRRPLLFLGLVVGALAVGGLLIWLGSALNHAVPLRAWLLSLLIQQPIQIALVGVGLARRAAEVGLAAAPRSPDYG